MRTDGERANGEQAWRECRALDPTEGERRYVQNVRIAKSRDFGPVNLVYHWAEGEEEPWRLVTNLSPDFTVVRFYQRRMWIEQLFGDWQEERFHLHQTRLYEPETLSRLILGLSLVYVWLVAVGSYVAGARLAPARRPYWSSRPELSGDWTSVDQKMSSESRAASNAIITLLLKTVR
ncbi:transposase [Salinibacter ruber]|uniref:transposase n=1 Tax=Salinibacter ruber TaxID=146919 RepID=UPI003C6E04AF